MAFMCECNIVAYISSDSSNSNSSRSIVWFFRWNASSKYFCRLLTSVRSSSHFMFRKIVRHSWFIFAKFSREKASSRFSLFCGGCEEWAKLDWFQWRWMFNWLSWKSQSIAACVVELLLRCRHDAANIWPVPLPTFAPIYWRLLSSFPLLFNVLYSTIALNSIKFVKNENK